MNRTGHLHAIDLHVQVGDNNILKRPLEFSPVAPSKRIRLASDAYVDGGMLLGAEGGPRYAHTSHTGPPPTPGPSPSRSPHLPATSLAHEDSMDIDHDPVLDQYGQPMHVFPWLSDENTISDELAHSLLQAPRLGCIPLPSCGPDDYWNGYNFTHATSVTPRKRVDERTTLTPEPEPECFKFVLSPFF